MAIVIAKKRCMVWCGVVAGIVAEGGAQLAV